MERSLNGKPLVISCIENEPVNCPDFSKPWPLKGLMDDIIDKNKEDLLFIKDEFNEDLLVHAFQTSRVKSYDKLLQLQKDKGQPLIASN